MHVAPLPSFDDCIVRRRHGPGIDLVLDEGRVRRRRARHNYQMVAALRLDPTWDDRWWGRKWATETLEELFAMRIKHSNKRLAVGFETEPADATPERFPGGGTTAL